MERRIDINLVDSNLDNIIFIVAIIGVERKAHIIHQNWYQNKSATIKTKELKFNLSHITFGSIKFQVINWGIFKAKSKKNDIQTLSKVTSE